MMSSEISSKRSDISLNSSESSMKDVESVRRLCNQLCYFITQLIDNFKKSLTVCDDRYVC